MATPELNLEEILARNPGIDRTQFEKMMHERRRFREQGVKPKEYDLDIPFGGKRVAVPDDLHNDSHVVHLK